MASRRYKRCVFVVSAQSGKSETLLDIIGQRLDQEPAPILYVGPSKQFITEQWEPRVMALLNEAPTLAGKVARGKRMTKTRKVIAGVPLRLAHGGSSTALKSDPASLAVTDEADELMANIKGQGDPVGLVDARGDTYADFVHAMVSTTSRGPKAVEIDPISGLGFWKVQPADEIDSTIWTYWQSGTRHHWTWCCPRCGERFVPRFDCLEFEGKGDETKTTPARARESAHLICPRRGCRITNDDKAEMNRTGIYVAPGQALDAAGQPVGDPPASDTASYWVSGLCSPFRSFGDRAAKYVEAVQTGDPDKVQTVMNAGFGELWSPQGGDVPDWQEVAALKSPYLSLTVPLPVILLTAGIDVQGNRLVYVIRGWGARATSWLVQHGELWGATAETAVWTDLAEVLRRTYDGLPVKWAFVDSGFRPGKKEMLPLNRVYDFCRRHRAFVHASKGSSTPMTKPLVVSRIEVEQDGKADAYGLDLVRLDSGYWKGFVQERLRWPVDQPGAFHLSQDATDDYCQALVSEAPVRKPGGGWIWVPRTRNNHFLDCEAMAAAAGYLAGAQNLTAEQRRVDRGEKIVPPHVAAQTGGAQGGNFATFAALAASLNR